MDYKERFYALTSDQKELFRSEVFHHNKKLPIWYFIKLKF
jgi:hypothetical protein